MLGGVTSESPVKRPLCVQRLTEKSTPSLPHRERLLFTWPPLYSASSQKSSRPVHRPAKRRLKEKILIDRRPCAIRPGNLRKIAGPCREVKRASKADDSTPRFSTGVLSVADGHCHGLPQMPRATRGRRFRRHVRPLFPFPSPCVRSFEESPMKSRVLAAVYGGRSVVYLGSSQALGFLSMLGGGRWWWLRLRQRLRLRRRPDLRLQQQLRLPSALLPSTVPSAVPSWLRLQHGLRLRRSAAAPTCAAPVSPLRRCALPRAAAATTTAVATVVAVAAINAAAISAVPSTAAIVAAVATRLQQ